MTEGTMTEPAPAVVEFTAVMESARQGGAGAVIPADALQALGGGSRFRVTGTLDDVALESSTVPSGGGKVCVGLHKATRLAAGVAVGDTVRLRLSRDDRPREISLPDDLAVALAEIKGTEAAYVRLPFTRRREYVEWVTGANRPETRARRVATVVDRLSALAP